MKKGVLIVLSTLTFSLCLGMNFLYPTNINSHTVEAAVTWPRGDFNKPFFDASHSYSGVYHGGCPTDLHGGYVGNGNYYCHA